MHEIFIGNVSYKVSLPHASTDYIQGKLASTGQPYELSMLQDMADRLKPEELVLDIGANIGNHTLYLANVAKCFVHAFEPNAALCQGLQQSIDANNLHKRITLHQVGVSDVAGFAAFDHLDESNLGAQSLAVQESKTDGAIELIRLDDLSFQQPVRMIKIDVEGMEIKVLEGAVSLIKACRPMLYIEAQTVTDFETQLSFLRSFGYLYLNTFNSTPTHLYVHESDVGAAVDISLHLSESQRKAYANAELKKQFNLANLKYRESSEQVRQLKAQLHSSELDNKAAFLKVSEISQKAEGLLAQLQQANLKYKGSSEQVIQLKEQLHSRDLDNTVLVLKLSESARKAEQDFLQLQQLNLKYRDSSEKIIQLKDQLNSSFLDNEALVLNARKAEQNLTQLQQANQAVELQLKKSSAKYRQLTREQIPALKSKLENQSVRSQELYDRVEALNKLLKAERQSRAKAERSLSALKSSRTWKVGVQVRKASSSIVDAIKLPFRLYRLGKAPSLSRLPNDPVEKPQLLPKDPAAQPAINEVVLAELKTHPLIGKSNREIRIACIMDEFTFGSYQPEAQLSQLTPEHWQSELEACQPELLFIESAWRGKDDLWGSKVGHCSTELQGIVAWCKVRGIPTLFWNKEDPVHFETFLTTAKLFDFVFTTDMDCIQRYKAALGHDQVYFLPFACQPQIHNPIEKYQRKDGFCFAGAYYVRYPERTRDLESFVAELPSFKPLEIYDRNYGKDHPDYQFPEQYQPYIVGTLAFDEIDKAYKGYNYAINLNSIKQSQSMFARRVYELLGSNTLTVSNFSRGLRLMFGDLVLTSDSGAEIKRRLGCLQEQGAIDRLRLAGLRKAMSEHTYTDRLNYALEKITGQSRDNGLPSVHVVAPANSLEEVQRQFSNIQRQQGISCVATLVVSPELLGQTERLIQEQVELGSVRIISNKELSKKSLQQLAGQQYWVATMHPQDYYGSHYLQDILLATRYTQMKVIGKGSWHSHQFNALQRHNSDEAYQYVHGLAARRSVISPDIAADISVDDFLRKIDSYSYKHPQQFAVDCYNYCENLPEQMVELQAQVDDFSCSSGISLRLLQQDAETAEPLTSSVDGMPCISGQQLALWLTGKQLAPQELMPQGNIQLTRNKSIKTQIEDSALHIQSILEDGKHEYIYAPKMVRVEDLTRKYFHSPDHSLDIHFSTTPGLNLNLVLLYLDDKGERVSHQMILPNRNSHLQLPDNATQIKVGLRVYAGGSADIKSIIFGHLDLEPGNIQGQSDVLLLTNHYPSYDNLYRNGFVHTRVRAYAEQGIKVDIFRLRKEEPIRWHEFQDADVTTGSQNALRKMLQSGRYRHVLVHFLDPVMWEVLKEFISDIRVTVWVHGADIQPWYRRKFNFKTEEQLENAKRQSEMLILFWSEILRESFKNLKLVFVSRFFAEQVMEDLGFRIAEGNYEIIHNPIDTDCFNYIKKPIAQRKKILSIRPYASAVYANDLSVKAIELLSKESWFSQLEIRMIGDGPLFEEILQPLKKYSNVIVERRFLQSNEISALHKEYGIFLCPSRMDTQGVSRDEAMSSGLVPITNAVAAIPEFVDDSCGVLAEEESHKMLAMGIARLYWNPSVFEDLSASAASKVRSKVDKKYIIPKEISLFF